MPTDWACGSEPVLEPQGVRIYPRPRLGLTVELIERRKGLAAPFGKLALEFIEEGLFPAQEFPVLLRGFLSDHSGVHETGAHVAFHLDNLLFYLFYIHYSRYSRLVNRCVIGYDAYRKEMMKVPSKKPFLAFLVDEDLLRAIDDFRFRWRFESRAAAIKWLLAWALRQDPKPDERK